MHQCLKDVVSRKKSSAILKFVQTSEQILVRSDSNVKNREEVGMEQPIPRSVPPHLQVDFKLPIALVRFGEDGLGLRRLAGYKTSPFPWDRIQRDTADGHFEFVE